MQRHPQPDGWGLADRLGCAALAAALATALLTLGRPAATGVEPPPGTLAVDLNSAEPRLLLALPGLGPTRVERLQAARLERPFDSLDDVARRVKGIGPATLEGLRPFARVAPTPGANAPTDD